MRVRKIHAPDEAIPVTDVHLGGWSRQASLFDKTKKLELQAALKGAVMTSFPY